MFDSSIEIAKPGRVTRYRISEGDSPLSYATVLDLWQSDPQFRNYFTTLLRDSPFVGYRWETPAITETMLDRPFEFVLINTPGFAARETDANAYSQYFTDDDSEGGIVSFANLGRDATLVVPSPRTAESAYGHLAAFVRNAPRDQLDAIWRVVSNQVQSLLGTKPLWVSTAGGGVAWLHVRLDARPKYYGYTPYKSA